MTPARPNAQPQQPPARLAMTGDGAFEHPWPTALRALLLLTEAAHPGDALLARLSDDDLALLRASMARLAGAEPTSAA
ncbi:MAG TPA: hypothetical protein PKD53_03625 [Chloroflexaceae bacterium]|nr:hypothetical protein [Chloroflexaceae bacterium]